MNSEFFNLCKKRDLTILQNFYEQNKHVINIHANNEFIFLWSCENGYLEVAKWLWSLNQNINIHANDEFAFRWSCLHGHLETAKWLWSLDKNIDIHAINDRAFDWSFKISVNFVVSKWLLTLDDNFNRTTLLTWKKHDFIRKYLLKHYKNNKQKYYNKSKQHIFFIKFSTK